MASKEDLDILETTRLTHQMDKQFSKFSQQLTVRLGGIMCAGIGVLGFLFVYLPH